MAIDIEFAGSEPAPLKSTPLAALHAALGARMVPFAGYMHAGAVPGRHHRRAPALPHAGRAVRRVPHGPGEPARDNAAAAFEALVPGDILGLKPGRQRYTLLLNEAGGIRDDLMVATLAPDHLFLVVNASRKDDDFTHIAVSTFRESVTLERHEDRALLALQGPQAATVLGRLAPAAATLPFMGVPVPRSPAPSVSSRAPATPARTVSRSPSRRAMPRLSPGDCSPSPR